MTAIAERALSMIPLDKVKTNGYNPRGKVNTESEAFSELLASISMQGILQPILVGPPDDTGTYTVIAGHRRLAAAQVLKTPDIPAMVADLKGEEALAALIENVQREDLTPVQEAKALERLREDFGMTQKEAARRLGKSERWARERQRLVAMPEATQDAFDKGVIQIEAAPAIEKIAEQHPAAADALAALATLTPEDAEPLNYARPNDLVYGLQQVAGEEATGCMVRKRGITIDVLRNAGLPEKALALFATRYAEIKAADPYRYGASASMALTDQDMNAARAYGCLLEVEHRRGQTLAYVTDPEWLVDRIDEALGKALRDAQKSKAHAAGASGVSSTPKERDDSPDAKEERKRQCEAEAEARIEARNANLELGQLMGVKLRSPKVTLEEAKVIAAMALHHDGTQIAGRGLVYTDPDLQTETEQKNGKVKVAYVAATDAAVAMWEAIEKAKTADEVFGVVLQALVGATYADDSCVAASSRVGLWSPPGSYGGATGVAEARVGERLRDIGAKRKVLPETIQKGVEQRTKEEAEEREASLLEQVSRSRAKAGVAIDKLYGVDGDGIERAVSNKNVKLHDGETPSYTITAAGKKRLKVLQDREKGRE